GRWRVPEQPLALAAIKWVRRPGGELRFWEHVAAPRGSTLRAAQHAVDVVWPFLGGGCHASRDTVAAIAAGGFEVERCDCFDLQRGPTKPHVLGSARSRSS